jgi:hypothetical protein
LQLHIQPANCPEESKICSTMFDLLTIKLFICMM